MLNKQIDRIIVPSKWVKDLWLANSKNNLKKKILVWEGRSIIKNFGNQLKKVKKYDFLIYIKNSFKNEIEKKCIKFLIENNFIIKIIKYGNYKRNDYLKNLRLSKN